MVLLLLFFLLLIAMVYFSFKMTSPAHEAPVKNEAISYTLSRPDISINVLLNEITHGKT